MINNIPVGLNQQEASLQEHNSHLKSFSILQALESENITSMRTNNAAKKRRVAHSTLFNIISKSWMSANTSSQRAPSMAIQPAWEKKRTILYTSPTCYVLTTCKLQYCDFQRFSPHFHFDCNKEKFTEITGWMVSVFKLK